ncbi:hypothetical protein FNB15_20765 [Ferrovibrio terrae]|uniref:Uncharacterized protein n=1 Tax=Ferrovibrio terrae TaxID=2594003 RepID=A0A516H758_9PROT|nr:hypothetical protein [Ferrovibrio terrae]QDO99545.1 hypothetical protein FNB15_20765 [Ferrovibrio terrae]
MSVGGYVGAAVFILLPSIIVYLILFFLYRRLLRRPVSRRRRFFAIAIALLLLAAVYGGPIYDFVSRGPWLIAETKRGDPVKLADGQPVYLPYSKYCTRDCAKLLLSGRVSAVYTPAALSNEPRFPWVSFKDEPSPADAPVMEWRLTNRPGACDDMQIQENMVEHTRYRALLAQGYCFTGTRLERPADGIEIWQRVWMEDKDPRRRVWQISRIAGGEREVLLRQPVWRVALPTFPPVFAFKIYYVPVGIGAFTIPIAISSDDFGTAVSLLTDLPLPKQASLTDGDKLGPLLIDEPETVARAALQSPSVYMQRSGVALICLMHQTQPDIYPARFQVELKTLHETAKDYRLRMDAGSVLRTRPKFIQCAMV